jgi:hypothetical protein
MTSWTNDGLIRQASLQEVRERSDKKFKRIGSICPVNDPVGRCGWPLFLWRSKSTNYAVILPYLYPWLLGRPWESTLRLRHCLGIAAGRELFDALDASNLFLQGRATKLPEEIEFLARAAKIAETAIHDSLSALRPGNTEWHLRSGSTAHDGHRLLATAECCSP